MDFGRIFSSLNVDTPIYFAFMHDTLLLFTQRIIFFLLFVNNIFDLQLTSWEPHAYTYTILHLSIGGKIVNQRCSGVALEVYLNKRDISDQISDRFSWPTP